MSTPAYRACRSEDIALLYCHVRSSDHMIKETCEPGSRSPSTLAARVPSLKLTGLLEALPSLVVLSLAKAEI